MNETKPSDSEIAPDPGSETAYDAAPSSSPLSALVAALTQHPQNRSLTITHADICFIVIMNGCVASVTARPRMASDPPQSVVFLDVDDLALHGYPAPTSTN
jgi:hypothetical protein